jgi:hypothetical protein
MDEAGAANYAPHPGIHHFPRIYVTGKSCRRKSETVAAEESCSRTLLSEDKKYQARVTAILESNWKSANTVAGDSLEELDSNARDALSRDEVNGSSSGSDSRLGMLAQEDDIKAL